MLSIQCYGGVHQKQIIIIVTRIRLQGPLVSSHPHSPGATRICTARKAAIGESETNGDV